MSGPTVRLPARARYQATFAGERQEVRQAVRRLGQVMHGIGIVPEQPKIGGAGRHGGEPPDHLHEQPPGQLVIVEVAGYRSRSRHRLGAGGRS